MSTTIITYVVFNVTLKILYELTQYDLIDT